MRSLLTMLGIIIGVSAVIAMISIGNGAKAQVEAQIANLGRNVILIMSGNSARGGIGMGFGNIPTLTPDDFNALRQEIPGINGVSPEVRTSSQIAAGNQNYSTMILGVGEDYLEIRSWPLANGNMFTEQDIRNANKVAILGKTTAQQLFGDGDPVGQIIRIKNSPFTVVGLLISKGMSMMGSDQDDIILVPHTTAARKLTGTTNFRSLNVQAATADSVNDIVTQIGDLLRQRHKIQPGRDDDFMIRTQQEISDTATATSRVMTVLLGAIASVSLLVGGIGIMNIMLVSVTERTREIGIRMAIGARGRDILWQFLIEAVTLAISGGLIGIAMGVVGSKLVSINMGWVTLISMDSILGSFFFSAAIGVFFGFYPARKAARLDPIDALRYE